jgi:hypothetical protein
MRTAIPVSRIPVRRWRRARQRGSEIVEFAALAFFLVPTFLWSFVNGMNLIRMNEANEVTRDIGDQYIHGVDYSTYEAQTVAQKLSGGFGLQIGSSFTGNNATNNANGGNAYIVLAQVMYIGSGSCSSLPSGTTCTNQNKYVFLQYISFGNATLQINGTQVQSAMGTTSAAVNSSGLVQNYLTDPNAVASTVGAYFQTQLTDGQVAYVAETFFSSPDLNFTAYPAGGIHSLDFF